MATSLTQLSSAPHQPYMDLLVRIAKRLKEELKDIDIDRIVGKVKAEINDEIKKRVRGYFSLNNSLFVSAIKQTWNVSYPSQKDYL